MHDLLPEGCYVILHIGTGPSHIEEKQNKEKGGSGLVVTGSDRFLLSNDIWIERLDEQLAKNIQTACEPPHYKISNVEQDRHLYAFVRRLPIAEKSRFEGLEELLAAAALSRLISPTSIGERYCAKVFHFGLKDSPIQSIQHRGMSPDVILSGKHRDWLSFEDAKHLQKLMPWLSKDKPMHVRVHRAYWNHEYAMRSFYLDMRWVLVVSGLEALVTIGESDLGRQFRERVGQLAGEFRVDLTDDDLRLAWTLRSKLVHAETFLYGLESRLPRSAQSELYEKLESLLRITIRRCLLDDEFGSYFQDDEAIAKRW